MFYILLIAVSCHFPVCMRLSHSIKRLLTYLLTYLLFVLSLVHNVCVLCQRSLLCLQLLQLYNNYLAYRTQTHFMSAIVLCAVLMLKLYALDVAVM